MHEKQYIISDKFLLCPHCGKKIQPIGLLDTLNTTAYCLKCKKYHRMVIANRELLKCEEVFNI